MAMRGNNAVFRPGTRLAWFVAVLAGIWLCPGQAGAAPVVDEAFFFRNKNILEVSTSYQALSPYDTYGNRRATSITFGRKETPQLNWFAQMEFFSRDGGDARLGTVGAYWDWHDAFYTYTSISAGSDSDYLPQFRLNQDFNFKFGPQKQYVWTIGGSYIKNHGDTRDYILSTGLTTYVKRWTFGYHVFQNTNRPGAVKSYTHEILAANGKEGLYMNTLTYAFGREAYLSRSEFAAPTAVRNDSKLVTLNHRRWLGLERDHGYFGELNYSNVKDGPRSVGLAIGIFREF